MDSKLLNNRWNLLGWVVFIFFIIGAMLYIWQMAQGRFTEVQEAPDPLAEFQPVACSSEVLTTNVNIVGNEAGNPVDVGVTLMNDSESTPCYMSTGYDEFQVLITSGDQTVFDSQVCKIGDASREILLDAGLETTWTIRWNGTNFGADCQGTSQAMPGTYVAHASVGGKNLTGNGVPFQLVWAGVGLPAPAEKPTDEEPSTRQESDPTMEFPAEVSTAPEQTENTDEPESNEDNTETPAAGGLDVTEP